MDIQESLHKIVTSEEEVDDYSKTVVELKESILDHINEFHMELETRWELLDYFTEIVILFILYERLAALSRNLEFKKAKSV